MAKLLSAMLGYDEYRELLHEDREKLNATSRLPLGFTSLPLGCLSAASRLPLAYISPTSRLDLAQAFVAAMVWMESTLPSAGAGGSTQAAREREASSSAAPAARSST